MICNTCHGKGAVISFPILGPRMIRILCPECAGSGLVSCCDQAGSGICEGGEAKPRPEPSR
jgi:DnaJ-class molecular chaperone